MSLGKEKATEVAYALNFFLVTIEEFLRESF